MTDHYETLGVPRGASEDDIKRAFRKKAGEHHPDRGGDSKAMAEVNRAHDVLSDPARRAEYDRTGRDGRIFTEDDKKAEARRRLRDMLEECLDMDEECQGDLVAALVGAVEKHIGAVKKAIKEHEKAIARIERRMKRLKGPSLFREIADRKLVGHRQGVAAAKDDIEIDKELITMIKEYTDLDYAQFMQNARQHGDVFAGVFAQLTGSGFGGGRQGR